jgi:peptide/nickel transport system permease protein
MASEGAELLVTSPHVMLAPGLAIAIVVLSINLLGDAVRDALDPRSRADSLGPARH